MIYHIRRGNKPIYKVFTQKYTFLTKLLTIDFPKFCNTHARAHTHTHSISLLNIKKNYNSCKNKTMNTKKKIQK